MGETSNEHFLDFEIAEEFFNEQSNDNKNDDENRDLDLTGFMECAVCGEKAPIDDVCFCDSFTAGTKNGPNETHNFCRECLEQHAKAATEEMPLAKGGLGLKCMMAGCSNPITFQEMNAFLSPNLVKQLQERADELCIVQAALNNVERCRKCSCAVEMEKTPAELQVFKCPLKDCAAQFCRLCGKEWDEKHKGISCEQFSKGESKERKLENRLCEVVIRKCPKCNIAFIKNVDCNLVTCKCGHRQCYICRADGIDYSHFCGCFEAKRNPDGTFKCEKCNKTCLQWEAPEALEKVQMEKIRAEKDYCTVEPPLF